MGVMDDLAPCGRLVASINVGNPVLAHTDAGAPRGVSVDIAAELAARLGVPVEYLCFTAARHSFAALIDGAATVGFLAIEPERAEQVHFSAPYALIDGVFVVPTASPLREVADVDAPGVRIGVKEGSAYDLFLTRSVQHAEVVRGVEGTAVLREHELEAGAGIRQPVSEFVRDHPQYRVIEEPFMQIRQAVALRRALSAETCRFVDDCVEDLKANGFIAASLAASGQSGVPVAPPGA